MKILARGCSRVLNAVVKPAAKRLILYANSTVRQQMQKGMIIKATWVRVIFVDIIGNVVRKTKALSRASPRSVYIVCGA